MILWGYVIDFSVFQLQKSLKIVINVVFVKLKVNFSQAINALLTGWCLYTGRHKALGPRIGRALGFVSARIETSAS